MRGEKLAWYELAFHLRSPLQRVQRETTSNEFDDWCWYLKRKEEAHDRWDYLFAMVASEIRRSYAQHARGVRMKDFLLKVIRPSEKTEKQKREGGKSFFMRCLGIKGVKK